MEIAFDSSFGDYPCFLGLPREESWGERGLENMFDSALAAGVRRIHFRSYCAGPWWPTKVKDAAPYMGGFLVENRSPFAQWNVVAAAVEMARKKGVTLIAWVDPTEGHAGNHTRWALRHPEFTLQQRDGTREDGYSADPIISIAYPEVVEFRLAMMRELLSFGVDGVFLVIMPEMVGYEPPSSEGFVAKHGIDPRDVPEDDPRWIEHQRGFLTAFIRKVRGLISEESERSGREIEFLIEGQGIPLGPLFPPEPGRPRVEPWLTMPPNVDVETIAAEGLADCICFWRLAEIDALPAAVRDNVRIGTRFRMPFSEEDYRARTEAARERGVSVFIVNEVRDLMADYRWIYPGDPGPLYVLKQQALARGGIPPGG